MQEQAAPCAIRWVCEEEDQCGWTGNFHWNSRFHLYNFWKKGRASQEEYKDVTRVCRGKIKRQKPSKNLIWTPLLKIIKNAFTNIIAAIQKPRRISVLYWVLQETLSLRMRKRLRFSVLSLLLALIVRLVIPVSPWTEKQEWEMEKNKHTQFRMKQLVTYYCTCNDRSPWEWMRSTWVGGYDCQDTSIIFQQSWSTREVPAEWRLVIVMLIYKKGQKEHPGNYRPLRLTLVLGQVMEQIILSEIAHHV